MTPFDEAYSQFSSLSADAISGLSGIIALIEEGIAPTNDRSEKLISSLRELRGSYELIQTIVQRELGDDFDATSDSSVLQYRDQLYAFRAQVFSQQVDAAKRLLVDFMRVESDITYYQDALRPLQDEAQRAYETLSNDPNTLTGQSNESSIDISKPQDFMSALEMGDYGSDEGTELLNRIRENISLEVMLGLAQKSYYLPTSTDTTVSTTAGETTHEPETESTNVGEAKLETEATSFDSDEHDPASETGAERVDLEDEILSIHADEPIGPVRPVKANASLGARQLERKLLRNMTYEVRNIISILMRFGACTKRQLVAFAHDLIGVPESIEDVDIEESILRLERVDVACTFELDGEFVYVLTMAGQRCLMKETIRNHKNPRSREPFWPIPFEAHDLKAGAMMRPSELRRVVSENTALLEQFDAIRASKGKPAAVTMLRGTHRVNGAYVSDVVESEANQGANSESSSGSDGADDSDASHEGNGDACAGKELISVAIDDADHEHGAKQVRIAAREDEKESESTTSSADDGEVSLPDAGNVHDDGARRVDDDKLVESEMSDLPVSEGADSAISLGEGEPDEEEVLAQRECAEAGHHGTEGISADSIESEQNSNTADDSACETSQPSLSERVRQYVEGPTCPPDEAMYGLAMDMIDAIGPDASAEEAATDLATVVTLMKAVSGIENYDECYALYGKLSYALEPFSEEVEFTSSSMSEVLFDISPDEEGLLLAACLNAMAFPRWGRVDHGLWSECKNYLDSYGTAFPSYDDVKPLYRMLFELHEVSDEGFSRKAMKQMDSSKSIESQMTDLAERARRVVPKSANVRHEYGSEFSDKCVGDDSDIGRAARMIAGLVPKEKDFLERQCKRFCEACDSGYVASTEKIYDYVKEAWHDTLEGPDKKSARIEPLKSYQSAPAVRACKERIDLIIEWMTINDSGSDVDLDKVANQRGVRDGVLEEIAAFLGRDTLTSRPGIAVVKCALMGLRKYLTDGDGSAWINHAGFLSSGLVSLDDNLEPIINDSLNAVRYAEPWRNILRHYLAEPLSLEQAKQQIDNDPDSAMRDNLTQLKHIHALLGTSPHALDKRFAQAKRAAKTKLERFENELEMDVLFDLIDDNQKETIDSTWRAYEEYFFEIGDFGLWSQFIAALQQQVVDFSKPQHDYLARELANRYALLEEDEDTSLLDMAKRMLDEDPNFATVEECINLFDEGERTFIEDAGSSISSDSISDFLDDEKHASLYGKCVQQMLVNEAFSVAGKQILRDMHLVEKEDDLKRRGAVLSHWPDSGSRSYGVTDGARLEASTGRLLRGLGFAVRSPKLIKAGAKCTQFEIGQQKADQGRTDYPHPIDKFGTDAPSKLQVLIFPGHVGNSTIFDEVEKLQNMDVTVVIVDKAMSLSDRRAMAETCHRSKSGLSPFICIDQVLALHLAMIEPDDRLPELLRSALPFARHQPFSIGSGSINDEMFVGRSDELARIVDPMGSTLVYGGRQLGKSVLLEHAERYFASQNAKYVSALCKIETLNKDDELVEAAVGALRAKKLKLPQRIGGIADLCDSLDKALADNRAERILLLIDEADEYLKAIRPNNYANIIPMVNLMRKTRGRFKFVFAGTHNVIRARKAFEQNGTLGQFAPPVCVRPLARRDALRLIERPLSYLGYHVDEYPHLMTILTKTNYYPGILQLFGYTLVESIPEHYGRYYRAADGNPPYDLSPRQLADVLKKKELKDSIREKFQMSLDVSKRYAIIAKVIALLYRECEEADENIRERDGFDVTEIWYWIDELKFPVFGNDDKESFAGLLDEMCEMNILFKSEGATTLYRLRHYDFLSFIGGDTVDEILEELGRFA